MPARSTTPRHAAAAVLSLAFLAACGGAEHATPGTAAAGALPGAINGRLPGTLLTLADTTIAPTIDAAGVAEPLREATLGTRLMGTVQAVPVQEGATVAQGQLLVEIDARDLAARATQVAAGIADAEAVQQEAARHAARFRALYADSAATRAQLEAAEAMLTRADAGVRTARAGAAELEVSRSYATVRAPFAGVVAARLVDPGALAAPGMPLVTVQEVTTLRLRVTADAGSVRALRRGQPLEAIIDGAPVTATIEGIVPAGAGNLFAVNALVPNPGGRHRAGSAATLALPQGTRTALLVPMAAVVREGDLTGVVVRGPAVDARRWVRLGPARGALVEVVAGLAAGDQVVVPAVSPAAAPMAPERE
jgi:RND family efflux transporter MFP subunit